MVLKDYRACVLPYMRQSFSVFLTLPQRVALASFTVVRVRPASVPSTRRGAPAKGRGPGLEAAADLDGLGAAADLDRGGPIGLAEALAREVRASTLAGEVCALEFPGLVG